MEIDRHCFAGRHRKRGLVGAGDLVRREYRTQYVRELCELRERGLSSCVCRNNFGESGGTVRITIQPTKDTGACKVHGTRYSEIRVVDNMCTAR